MPSAAQVRADSAAAARWQSEAEAREQLARHVVCIERVNAIVDDVASELAAEVAADHLHKLATTRPVGATAALTPTPVSTPQRLLLSVRS